MPLRSLHQATLLEILPHCMAKNPNPLELSTREDFVKPPHQRSLPIREDHSITNARRRVLSPGPAKEQKQIVNE